MPEVMTVPITMHDEFIIIGCAGLWSVFSDDAAVKLVREKLFAGASPEAAARVLVNAAKNGTDGAYGKAQDSVSAIVLQRPLMRNSQLLQKQALDGVRALAQMPADKWMQYSVAIHPLFHAISALYTSGIIQQLVLRLH